MCKYRAAVPPFCSEVSVGLGELKAVTNANACFPSSSFQYCTFHSFFLYFLQFFPLFTIEYTVNKLSLMMVTLDEAIEIPCDSLWFV